MSRVAGRKYPIPATGDAAADEVIRRLTLANPTERWRAVHEKFDDFKQLPFFKSFDWEYYAQYPHFVRDWRAAA